MTSLEKRVMELEEQTEAISAKQRTVNNLLLYYFGLCEIAPLIFAGGSALFGSGNGSDALQSYLDVKLDGSILFGCISAIHGIFYLFT